MALAETAIKYTLINEGGFTNNPQDHGGPTNYGVIQSEYSTFLGRHASIDDVRNMPLEDAIQIYKAKYWPESFDDIQSQSIATAIFDFGVLHGPQSARKLAQQCCNKQGSDLTVDGSIGSASVEALNNCDTKQFIADFSSGMKSVFESIVANNHTQKVFLAGWLNRAARTAKLA